MRVREPNADDLAFVSAIEPNATIAGFVPARYEAYVRCFHEAGALMPDRSWAPLSWTAAARIQDVALTATTRWQHITGSVDAQTELRDGTFANPPDDGRLSALTFNALLEELLPNTQARTFSAAFWAGWEALSSSETDLGRRIAAAIRDHQLLYVYPHQYALFELSFDELTGSSWMLDPAFDWPTHGLTPALLWPHSREWCLATDIDFDSTIVGCSAYAASSILTDPRLDAVSVQPATNLARLAGLW